MFYFWLVTNLLRQNLAFTLLPEAQRDKRGPMVVELLLLLIPGILAAKGESQSSPRSRRCRRGLAWPPKLLLLARHSEPECVPNMATCPDH